jgi:hypothetical protein
MVGEAPRADERSPALREGASHGHRARAAERDHPRFEQLDLAGANRVGLAQELLRLDLEVAHTRMLDRCAPSHMKAATPERATTTGMRTQRVLDCLHLAPDGTGKLPGRRIRRTLIQSKGRIR